jgi:hypothetical protein
MLGFYVFSSRLEFDTKYFSELKQAVWYFHNLASMHYAQDYIAIGVSNERGRSIDIYNQINLVRNSCLDNKQTHTISAEVYDELIKEIEETLKDIDNRE